MSDQTDSVRKTLREINPAWQSNKPAGMSIHLHPEIVMTLPGFTGEVRGRDAIIASFADFCSNARVIEYGESDEQATVIGECAVAIYRFEMLYERAQSRARSRGRDLWLFHHTSGRWVAVWRTMMELEEERENRT